MADQENAKQIDTNGFASNNDTSSAPRIREKRDLETSFPKKYQGPYEYEMERRRLRNNERERARHQEHQRYFNFIDQLTPELFKTSSHKPGTQMAILENTLHYMTHIRSENFPHQPQQGFVTSPFANSNASSQYSLPKTPGSQLRKQIGKTRLKSMNRDSSNYLSQQGGHEIGSSYVAQHSLPCQSATPLQNQAQAYTKRQEITHHLLQPMPSLADAIGLPMATYPRIIATPFNALSLEISMAHGKGNVPNLPWYMPHDVIEAVQARTTTGHQSLFHSGTRNLPYHTDNTVLPVESPQMAMHCTPKLPSTTFSRLPDLKKIELVQKMNVKYKVGAQDTFLTSNLDTAGNKDSSPELNTIPVEVQDNTCSRNVSGPKAPRVNDDFVGIYAETEGRREIQNQIELDRHRKQDSSLQRNPALLDEPIWTTEPLYSFAMRPIYDDQDRF